MGFDLFLVGPSEGFFAGKDGWPEGAYLGLGATRLGCCTDAMDDLGMLNGTLPPDQPDEETFAVPQKSVEHDGQLEQEDDKGSPEYAAYQAAVDRWLAYDPAAPGIAYRKLISNDGFQVTPEECASALAVWDALDTLARVAVRERVRLDEETEYGPNPTGTEQGATAGVGRDGSYVPDPESVWDSWIDWLRRAQDAGGFWVC
jgi:hypothetical protein